VDRANGFYPLGQEFESLIGDVQTLKEKIIALRSQGKTYDQIKAELNCSKGTISYHVGEGQKEKAGIRSLRQRERNMLLFHRYKEEKGCFDCGKDFPHYVLEFDHKPEFEKTDGVYRVMKTLGIDKAWEEVAKCDVVCANCHKVRTYERKPWGSS
jgi:hypothetical protein